MEPPGVAKRGRVDPDGLPIGVRLHTYDTCAQLVPHKRTRTYTRVQGSSEKSPPETTHA